MAAIRKLFSTKHRLRLLAVIFGVSLIYVLPFLALPGMAAIYLKFDGVDGEATAKGHEKWIEVQSFQFGVARPVSRTGGGADTGIPSVSDILLSKPMDKSSMFMFTEAVLGQPRNATLHFTKMLGTGAEATYYEVTLSDVLVSSFSQSSGGEAPSESMSLNFGKIAMKYTQYDSKGGVLGTTTASWDVMNNTK